MLVKKNVKALCIAFLKNPQIRTTAQRRLGKPYEQSGRTDKLVSLEKIL